jgi:hypothetical protein
MKELMVSAVENVSLIREDLKHLKLREYSNCKGIDNGSPRMSPKDYVHDNLSEKVSSIQDRLDKFLDSFVMKANNDITMEKRSIRDDEKPSEEKFQECYLSKLKVESELLAMKEKNAMLELQIQQLKSAGRQRSDNTEIDEQSKTAEEQKSIMDRMIAQKDEEIQSLSLIRSQLQEELYEKSHLLEQVFIYLFDTVFPFKKTYH